MVVVQESSCVLYTVASYSHMLQNTKQEVSGSLFTVQSCKVVHITVVAPSK